MVYTLITVNTSHFNLLKIFNKLFYNELLKFITGYILLRSGIRYSLKECNKRLQSIITNNTLLCAIVNKDINKKAIGLIGYNRQSNSDSNNNDNLLCFIHVLVNQKYIN